VTIAKRLILLLAVPLLALTGLGVFTRWQLTTIETRSRFVAELQVPSLATLGNISRILADLRVQLRNHVLAASEAERASVRSTFERDDAELDRLLDQYERNLVSEDRDRRLLRTIAVSTGIGWTGRSRSCRSPTRDAVKKPVRCCARGRRASWVSG